ncbi:MULTISPECIES: methylamine utilization protein [unclassified Halomonas]|uniref:methylamine utilization protein n=1 Tax=unclassified Halomonas TaxID=2609666 RepID=UPI002076B260|nr:MULTISPECIES: methylamine utilization protein [unclassified Halomonas]
MTASALFTCAFGVSAATITVTDSTGAPLEDAVVEVHYAGAAAPAREGEVYQRGAAFHPHVLTVPVGSYVSFPNQDTTRHHVYSFSPAKTFELNLYLQETPEPVLFDQPGVVVLGCNIHDQMQAFIVVTDAPFADKTGAAGVVQTPALPEGAHAVRVWHPRLDDRQRIWWEGEIQGDQPLNVRLELNAIAPETPPLSPLQQRFHQANEH